jgi:hypothetical protein
MTDKLPRTRTELEALGLAELRATSQCRGAVHVTVVAYDDHRVPATWEVASCDAGTSPPDECPARALQSGRAGRSLRSPAQQFDIAR